MEALARLAELIAARSGIVVGAEKQYLLESRLAPILRRERLSSLQALADRVGKGGCDALECDITEAVATHETLFFRDAKPFEHLRTVGLPALLRERPDGARLRIWSAAAATGQETYSIAMMLAEAGVAQRCRAEILGTDLARAPLERARAGLYTQYEVQRGLSVHRLLDHFIQQGNEWQINEGLRAACRFRQWNLLDDPGPLGRFDVVFCRNVLFYFSREVRAQVLGLIRRHMAPDGLLYLGAAETASGIDDTLERDGPVYRLARPAGARSSAAPSAQVSVAPSALIPVAPSALIPVAPSALISVAPSARASATPATQVIAPRAEIGQTHSTLPCRTPTYQS